MFSEEFLLITGGSGLLGSSLRNLFQKAKCPSKNEFDVTDFKQMDNYVKEYKIQTMLHAAAFTSPPKVDSDPGKALEINIIGTANVVKLAIKHNFKIIYISTDYVFRGDRGRYEEEDELLPVNKYAWSKLGGECAVRLYDNSVIIRTSFGPDIFPYEKAFYDQWTSRESVSLISELISKVVISDFKGIIHIGGERKSVHEYATRLNPDKKIEGMSIKDIGFMIPKDTSLNTGLFAQIFSK
jgi:dTDP-4-dehydrorhamnose reductase